MNKKGFTLLELLVVAIIIGIMASIGLTQYGRVIEKSRGAEARMVLGSIRQYAIAYRLENGTITAITAGDLSIGTANDQIPSVARGSHYFVYSIVSNTDPTILVRATRNIANGKTPNAATAFTLDLSSNLSTGVDTWSGTGNY